MKNGSVFISFSIVAKSDFLGFHNTPQWDEYCCAQP